MKEKKKLNFLLYGEGSFLNRGCEAIVNTTIHKIKNSCEGNITLATNDIEYDSKYYNNIITKYVKQSFENNDALKEEITDICLSVGGDNYCYGEPKWLYEINKNIKAKNKKNVLWCASLYEEIESDEMIKDLRTYDVIVVRESLSYKAVTRYVDKEHVLLLPDTAFSLGKKEVKLPNIFKKGKKVIGINVSPLISKFTDNKNNILDSLKELINYILKETDLNIALIPHVYIEGNNDLDSLKMIKDIYKQEQRIELLNEKIYDCEELKFIISNCSFFIPARTHASIAAYSSLVPTLVIGYSVKSKGIALDLFGDYENFVIPVDKMTPELLLNKFKYIQENEKQIIKILQEKIPSIQEKSNNLINALLEKIEYLDEKYITDKYKCTGCMACLNICPNDAIEIIKSKDGFEYTKINKEKCIGCNLCKKVCPSNKYYKNEYNAPEYYAAFNLEEKDRIKSSSGGMVSLIAKTTLKKKGVVYGVALEEKQAKNIRIDNEKELYKIMGSKYVQSEIGHTLKNVKQDLDDQKQVLFTGTPCQIEGLRSYLNKDYNNLTCVSIICHGVPSPEIFKKYIEEKEKKNSSKLKKINFRNKQLGWHNYNIEYEYDNGKKEVVPASKDIYMSGYLKDYFLRECCYNCQMKYGEKSTADIIIGDFWGIESTLPEIDDDKGVSAIVINSAKGKDIFEELKANIKYEKVSLEDISNGNPMLVTSTRYTKNKDNFFKLIESHEISTYIEALKSSGVDSNEQEKLYEQIQDLNGWVNELVEAKEFFLDQIRRKDEKIQEDEKEKQKLRQELEKIYSSKRWRYTNKIGNTFNKIIRKKKK